MTKFVERFKTGLIIFLLILISLMVYVNYELIKYSPRQGDSMALCFIRAVDENSIKLLSYENIYFNLGYQHNNPNADFRVYWGNSKNNITYSAQILEKTFTTADSTWKFTISLPKTTEKDSVYIGIKAVLNDVESDMSNILAFIPEVKKRDLVEDEQHLININDIRDLLKFHGKTSDKSL